MDIQAYRYPDVMKKRSLELIGFMMKHHIEIPYLGTIESLTVATSSPSVVQTQIALSQILKLGLVAARQSHGAILITLTMGADTAEIAERELKSVKV